MEDTILEDREALIEYLKHMIAHEHAIVKAAKETVKYIKSEFVKQLIESISLDSSKHALLFNSIITYMTSESPFISEDQRDEIGKKIKEHIKLENEAIRGLSEKLPQIVDPNVETMIRYILTDERRHHRLLRQIYSYVNQEETLTTEVLWKLMFKEV